MQSKLFQQKKIIFFFLIITFLFCILILYTHFTNTSDLIVKKDLTFQFRQKVYIKDLIEKINGKLINNPLVDTNKVGKSKVQISYYNHYGFIENKYIAIEIRDLTPPTIVINSTYIVEKGETKNLLNQIFCADDYDDHVNCQIKGQYDLNKIGKYPLTITATDQSNNVTSKNFTLKVIDKQKESSEEKGEQEKTNFKDVYQKYKTKNTQIGLDLSKWQGKIDFSKIKEQGVEFVMIKIGGQSKKNAKIEMDPNFITNITGALENNLKVGLYFYSHATNEKEAKNQAEWLLNKIPNYNITMPIAFDWENFNQYYTYHISFHTLNNIANTFFQTIENKNYQTLLYSSKYYLETVWYQEEYQNWIAHYTNISEGKEKYRMWQLCNNGKIEGIQGDVDIDIFYLK